jgi:hypothetical protein
MNESINMAVPKEPSNSMTEKESAEFDEGAPRRFDVDLLIAHPTMTPADITAAMGLDAHFSHRGGEQVRTPTGVLLEGRYFDTRWRHRIRYEVLDQWFSERITMLVNRLAPQKEFLALLRATGGHASIIVQFLGDGYFGDTVPSATLAKMADLQLDFGIEVFNVPQS